MYANKTQFLEALKGELLKRNISDNEILEDFEQHFNIGLSEGLSEQQVCEKLGNPAEIANQYAPEDFRETTNTTQKIADANTQTNTENTTQTNAGNTTQTAFAENNYNSTAPSDAYTYTGNDVNVAKIVGIICLDIFLLTWGIPTLFSLMIAYWGVMISFFAASVIIPISVLVGGPILSSIFGSMIFVSMLTPAAGIFAALILLGIALIMSAFCISIWKGFGKLMQSIGRLHYEVFTNKKAPF